MAGRSSTGRERHWMCSTAPCYGPCLDLPSRLSVGRRRSARPGRGSTLGGVVRHTLRTVGDVMSSPVVTVPPDATVAEAAARMHENRFGSVVVVDGARPVGIFTE